MRALVKFCTAKLEMMLREKDWLSQCHLSRLLCGELGPEQSSRTAWLWQGLGVAMGSTDLHIEILGHPSGA